MATQPDLQPPNPFVEDETAGPFFVGREHELERVDRWLSDVVQDQRIAVLVPGLHGTGKTSLLEKSAAMARQRGFVVAECLIANPSTSVDQLRSVLLQLVIAADSLPGSDAPLLDEWNRDPKRSDRKFLFPALETGPDPTALEHDLRFIFARVKRGGATGVILTLDEAQHAAHQTLSLLRNTVRKIASPLLLLVAVRVDAAPNGVLQAGFDWLRKLVGGSGADPGLERFFLNQLPISSFERPTAERLITTRLENSSSKRVTFAPGVVARVVGVTSGNPRQMIRLCHEIYERARVELPPVATIAHYTGAFHHVYAEQLSLVQEKVNALPSSQQRLLKVLADSRNFLNPTQVTALLYSADARQNDPATIAYVSALLDDLAGSCDGVAERGEDMFGIENEQIREAILLALKWSVG